MERLILDGDIIQLCKFISSLKQTKTDILKVKKVSIKVFVGSLIYSTNMYIALFLEKKLKALEDCSVTIFHKLCCEILVFLATVNKPTVLKSFTNQCDTCVNPQDKFLTALDFTSRIQCINTLFKDKHFTFMWDLAIRNSPYTDYIRSLLYLNSISPSKRFYFAAFNTLYENYYFSNTIYNKIIFQCMLKMSYLLDDENTLQQKMYSTCIQYVPDITQSVSQNEKVYIPSGKNVALKHHSSLPKQNMKKGDMQLVKKQILQ
jgi:hypothetical protein